MSHTTRLSSVNVKDIDAIRKAVASLQNDGVRVDLVENEKPRMWSSNQHGKCDFVLRLRDSKHDVGLERQEDGTFNMVFDDHAGLVSDQVGVKTTACALPGSNVDHAQQAVGKFLQQYTYHATVNSALAQGFQVEEAHYDQDGNIQIQLQED